MVALNRAISSGKAVDPEEGLAELREDTDAVKLKEYPFYPAAQGESYLLAGRLGEAGKYFEIAVKLVRSQSEADFFERKLKLAGSANVRQLMNIEKLSHSAQFSI